MASDKWQVTRKSKPAADLTIRTFEFARRVRRFVNSVPRSPANAEDVRQLIRSSGSVAANYVEAQEALSRKDFFYRIKVCRKEVRESELWLRLLDTGGGESPAVERRELLTESDELRRIFSAIAARDDTS